MNKLIAGCLALIGGMVVVALPFSFLAETQIEFLKNSLKLSLVFMCIWLGLWLATHGVLRLYDWLQERKNKHD